MPILRQVVKRERIAYARTPHAAKYADRAPFEMLESVYISANRAALHVYLRQVV